MMWKNRVLAGLSGNVALQGINAVIQLLGVPICLKYWGADYYGEWLLLFTIPGYLSISDLGLGATSGAEMSMMAEDHRAEEIPAMLKSVFWFIVLLGILPFGLLLLTNYLLPWYDWLKLKSIGLPEFHQTFPLLILYIYLSLFLTVPANFYRVIKKYHIERYISSGYRFIEFSLLILMISQGLGVFAVALGYLVLRFFYFLFLVFDLSKRTTLFRLWPIHVRFQQVRKIIRPGISSLLFYLGGNILNQGLSTIVGLNFGPKRLVMFNTVRTLINSTKQLSGIFNMSVYAEFSYALGARKMNTFIRLFRTSLILNVVFTLFCCVGLLFFGDAILQWWTKGVVSAEYPFFGLYLVYTVCGAISGLAMTVVFSTNQYRSTGIIYLSAIVGLILINSILIQPLGLSFTAISLVLLELILSFITIKVVLHIVGMSWGQLWTGLTWRDLTPMSLFSREHKLP